MFFFLDEKQSCKLDLLNNTKDYFPILSQNGFWDIHLLIINSIDPILGGFECGNNTTQTNSELWFNEAKIQKKKWKNLMS